MMDKVKGSVSWAGFVIFLWLLISGYIGIGGYSLASAIEEVNVVEKELEIDIVQGHFILTNKETFKTSYAEEVISIINQKLAKEKKLNFKQSDAIRKLAHAHWFYGNPWLSLVRFLILLPSVSLVILTVGAAGTFGASMRLIYEHTRKKERVHITESQYFAIPALGFFVAIGVAMISGIFPSLLAKGEWEFNTTLIIALSLLSGFFQKKFIEWLRTNVLSKFISTE